MEEVQNGANEAVAAPQDQHHEMPVQEAPVSEIRQSAPQADDDFQDRNWREMRRAYNDLKTIVKTQTDMIEHLKTAQTVPQQQQIDEFDAISDDEFIPKGKVKSLVTKEAKRIAQEIAHEEAKKLINQREQSQFLDKLKRQYSDFDEVVNPETLSLLEQHDPELATTIADLKDPYKIGLQSYKYIKALNLSSKVPESRRAKEVEKKLEKNAKTVQSPQVYEKRPLAQAFVMSDSEKKELYKEMINYAGQAGFGF